MKMRILTSSNYFFNHFNFLEEKKHLRKIDVRQIFALKIVGVNLFDRLLEQFNENSSNNYAAVHAK